MDFSRKKLFREESMRLRRQSVRSVEPYELLMAPVYVFFQRNEKFVAVKGPLDFFEPDEITKFSQYETFFVPGFVDSLMPFQGAARAVRTALTYVPRDGVSAEPASFELSDAVLRLLAPLWGPSGAGSIEPFFITAFTNELCPPISPEILKNSRNQDIEKMEKALICSSMAVFFALHLGHCGLHFLTQFRNRSFINIMSDHVSGSSRQELEELVALCVDLYEKNGTAPLTEEAFNNRLERVSRKLRARLNRIRSALATPDGVRASIFGEGGIVDV